jgi:hypothetical protein
MFNKEEKVDLIVVGPYAGRAEEKDVVRVIGTIGITVGVITDPMVLLGIGDQVSVFQYEIQPRPGCCRPLPLIHHDRI